MAIADLYDAITGTLFLFGTGLYVLYVIIRAIVGVKHWLHPESAKQAKVDETMDEMYGYAASRGAKQLLDKTRKRP